jgi:AraC family transcriptional regulator
MKPRIETINEKKLVGKRQIMSFANYTVGQLWGSFMPIRNEITNKVSANLISMVVYKPNHFENFNPENEFVRWAAVEVTDFENIPNEIETYILSNGLYAVFQYKGLSSGSAAFYQYIYSDWIPNSEFQLDNRPHFEILGEKYKNDDPTSEEEVWIPIKMK